MCRFTGHVVVEGVFFLFFFSTSVKNYNGNRFFKWLHAQPMDFEVLNAALYFILGIYSI